MKAHDGSRKRRRLVWRGVRHRAPLPATVMDRDDLRRFDEEMRHAIAAFKREPWEYAWIERAIQVP